MRRLRVALPALLTVVALAVGAVACGSDGGGSDALPDGTSAAGTRGRALVLSSGCLGCHSVDGSKKAGPTWKGLAGSQVTLTDGRTVVADATYLSTAITSPKSEGPAGYPSIMPEYPGMSEQDVADIVAYLQELPAD
ncbi:MAG: c-type cytochrome [Actinobacteria bacterium]|nr:c-type cytochrome [Actinomycetota bacterium]